MKRKPSNYWIERSDPSSASYDDDDDGGETQH